MSQASLAIPTTEEPSSAVQVAVRIRPVLSNEEGAVSSSHSISTVEGQPQIQAGKDYFTFDYVFEPDALQEHLYSQCTQSLVDSFFEGFNATVLAYGQTGSGKTFTMGSSADVNIQPSNRGIIPRVIQTVFEHVTTRERDDPLCSYTVRVQFLEIYGEDIRDLLDHTSTSKVSIRETPAGDVYVSGACEQNVNSVGQMMLILEEGSRHRTTAATRMNQTSSRSHAIFTLFLEQTIRPSPPAAMAALAEGEVLTVPLLESEVRKCKFHFVDLAGSERAKRTGAEGQQLREGIDINKGLLALGNVISALGDDSKKGKVHVPYRDSKLTRMLQDSLGGNSKTLMICCVSPDDVNFYESLNALRYANRARNIQNKPVVNRDPTSFIVSELKKQLQVLSSELLVCRYKIMEGDSSYFEARNDIPFEVLQAIANQSKGTACFGNPQIMQASSNTCRDSSSGSRRTSSGGRTRDRGRSDLVQASSSSSSEEKLLHEIRSLHLRLNDSESEVVRLTEQAKHGRQASSDLVDRLVLLQSELEFYKLNSQEFEEAQEVGTAPRSPAICTSANPAASAGYLTSLSFLWSSKAPESPSAPAVPVATDPVRPGGQQDKRDIVATIAGYVREIEVLKLELKETKLSAASSSRRFEDLIGDDIDSLANCESNEFSSSIAKIIAHTQEQLRIEEEILLGTKIDKNFEDDDVSSSFRDFKIEEEENKFQSRQKNLSAEVCNLTESIKMKEELVQQLQKSQQQYEMMKTFYHNRLETLTREMEAKQEERQRLVAEIESLAGKTSASGRASMEAKLKLLLAQKDDELKMLRRKHQEVNRLSEIQGKYTEQLAKLEDDIFAMKRQRVDLSKMLQQDKRAHLLAIAEKAREIEKLKKDLNKRNADMKRLAQDKERAEFRVKDALREGALLRKKANHLQKFGSSETAAAVTRARKIALSRVLISKKKEFSEEQLKTKNWLDKRLLDITDKEKIVNTLFQKYEQQLMLLEQRQGLERERDSIQSRQMEDGSLVEINKLMDALDQQLCAKVKDIDDIQDGLMDSSGLADNDRTLEHLQKYAKSLPEANEMIRMLFDMLVRSRVIASNRLDSLNQTEDRLKGMGTEIQEKRSELMALHRSKDLELTHITKIHEEKLFGLLEHSALGQMFAGKQAHVDKESVSFDANGDPSVESNDSITPEKLQAFLMLSNERVNFLKTENGRLARSSLELEQMLLLKESEITRLQNTLAERMSHIKFVEEECCVFKEIAEDLRNGMIAVVGSGTGQNIKELISAQSRERLNLYDEDDEEDAYNTGNLYDFSSLADEIQKTGDVAMSSAKAVVFDRLTNPSNFTGSQKNVFQQIVHVHSRKKDKQSNKNKLRRSLDGDNAVKEDEDRMDGVSRSVVLDCAGKDNTGAGDGVVMATTHPRASSGRPKPPLERSSSQEAQSLFASSNVFSRLNNPSRFTGIQKYRGLIDSIEELQIASLKGVISSPPRSRSGLGPGDNDLTDSFPPHPLLSSCDEEPEEKPLSEAVSNSGRDSESRVASPESLLRTFQSIKKSPITPVVGQNDFRRRALQLVSQAPSSGQLSNGSFLLNSSKGKDKEREKYKLHIDKGVTYINESLEPDPANLLPTKVNENSEM